MSFKHLKNRIEKILSKTVYIKAEPEDGAARVGQDSVEIGFEISDLGYDEEVEAANN